MKILIAGGTGFLGSALTRSLRASGHEVWILTRRQPRDAREIRWDGQSTNDWVQHLNTMNAVVNVTGYGLEHWPWSERQKRRFLDSRTQPGTALAAAVAEVKHKPRIFLQISGINYYGARGAGIADERSPAADDFLARLTVQWEAASESVEQFGVRRVVARTAVVLDARGGLFPLMALPVKLWAGGPLGDGRQAVPWIHLEDEIAAMSFLLDREDAAGAYNLIAPEPTSNAAFMRAVAHAMHRPYWLPAPGFMLRAVLGEMSTLVLDGRYSKPERLTQMGFEFRYPRIELALENLLHRQGV